MRKIIALLLVVVFVLAFSSVAFAFSVNMNNGLENSPVFKEQQPGNGVYFHTESPVGFDAKNDRMRIPPAEPGLNSADQSNVNVNPWNSNHSSVGDLS